MYTGSGGACGGGNVSGGGGVSGGTSIGPRTPQSSGLILRQGIPPPPQPGGGPGFTGGVIPQSSPAHQKIGGDGFDASGGSIVQPNPAQIGSGRFGCGRGPSPGGKAGGNDGGFQPPPPQPCQIVK